MFSRCSDPCFCKTSNCASFIVISYLCINSSWASSCSADSNFKRYSNIYIDVCKILPTRVSLVSCSSMCLANKTCLALNYTKGNNSCAICQGTDITELKFSTGSFVYLPRKFIRFNRQMISAADIFRMDGVAGMLPGTIVSCVCENYICVWL